jgi:glycyl-tRNA synthetase beta chain
MVCEFPELQGIVGGEYLRRENANKDTWMAVKEHYRPISSEDGIPTTDIGCILAITDKLDTIVGCFAIGLIPTGSKDPLALRRAGQGIIRILIEQKWNLNPVQLSSLSLDMIGDKATKPKAETIAAIEIFFRDRVAHQLEQMGYSGPIRRTSIASGWTNLVDLAARCKALANFSDDQRLQSLTRSAKRIRNILKDSATDGKADEHLLQEPAEKELLTRLANLKLETSKDDTLNKLAELALPLETFFDAVMVNCESLDIKRARLVLMYQLQESFLKIGDFSLWQ